LLLFSDDLTQVEAMKHLNIGQLAAGQEFTMVLTHDRQSLYTFGRSDYGQLGIGVVTQEGALEATPQLVKFPKKVSIRDIDAGDRHAMAITDQYELYTWGFNEEGTTGHALSHDIFRPRLLTLKEIVAKKHTNEAVACRVYGMSGGGQHSLMLEKYFAASL
jgi:alpha-tubulin suppressor-like RCC1 family protein